jgi:putative acetyltransferase
MRIIEDDLSSARVAALLGEHLEGMTRHSPPDSVHALDLARLRAQDIAFWTVWDGAKLLGRGALKELDARHGEIKSMRTANAYVGQGVGTAILSHIIEESVRRSYFRLSLETGSGPAFEPALSLYKVFGFNYCGPFGDYRTDPFSQFMTLELSSRVWPEYRLVLGFRNS